MVKIIFNLTLTCFTKFRVQDYGCHISLLIHVYYVANIHIANIQKEHKSQEFEIDRNTEPSIMQTWNNRVILEIHKLLTKDDTILYWGFIYRIGPCTHPFMVMLLWLVGCHRQDLCLPGTRPHRASCLRPWGLAEFLYPIPVLPEISWTWTGEKCMIYVMVTHIHVAVQVTCASMRVHKSVCRSVCAIENITL